MASGKAKIDMIHGPLGPSLLRFSIPLILTGILQLLYSAADLIVVGQFAENGDLALAAVGSTGSLVNLIVNLFLGLSVGAGVTFAIALGAGNRSLASRIVHTAMTLAVIFGLAVSTIGVLFSHIFLEWMGTPSDVLPGAVRYLRIYFLGVPALMVYNYGASLVRTTGNTRTPLLILATSGLLNVILNLVTVVFFGMAEAGVAWATVAANYFTAIAIVRYQMKSDDASHLSLRKLSIDGPLMGRILRCGVPAGVQSSIFSISNVLVQSAINSLGSTVMTGCVAAGNIEGFVYVAQNSFYHATLTFTGQNVGARNFKRIDQTMRHAALQCVVVWVVIAVISILFGEGLIGLYIPNNPDAIAPGVMRLQILVSTYVLCGMMEIVVGSSRGMGASILPMLMSVIGVCGIRVFWVLCIFPMKPTVPVLFLSYPISWTVTTAVQFIANRVTKRKLVSSSGSGVI